VLALLRLPDRVPGRPAVTPALALSLAWLFVTAYQRPWYDVMALSLLALDTASWLDWVVLIRLLAAVALVGLCISGRWGWRPPAAAAPDRLPELLPAP
jgi:hypothetical protein